MPLKEELKALQARLDVRLAVHGKGPGRDAQAGAPDDGAPVLGAPGGIVAPDRGGSLGRRPHAVPLPSPLLLPLDAAAACRAS